MNDISSINYEPLEAMHHSWWHVYKASFHGQGLLVNTAIILVGAVLIVYSGLGIYLVILWFIFLGYKVNRYKNQAWEAFATANDWSIDVNTSVETLVPISLQYGHSQQLSPIIQAVVGIVTADLFTYKCVTGEGKYQQSHVFTLAVASLPKTLPHMILFSKKAHPDIHDDLANHENLQLEGDFGNYFKLEIEKGQEVDVLTIITPEVMQTLITYDRAEDVEILGNNLYFIMRNDKRDDKDVQQLLQSVKQLASRISENIKLSTVTTPPQTTVAPQPAAVQ